MSRPIFEPSLQRTDRRLRFASDQLFRRPAPIAAAGEPTEWIKASSTTDLGTSFTMLDFTTSGNVSCFDEVTPTFAINGNGDLEIGKDGMYDLFVWIYDESTAAPNQSEVTWLRGYRNTGANPEVLGPGSFSSPREVRLLQRADDATVDTGNLAWMPSWYTPLVYFDGDIASDGVTDIIFEAYVEINGTGTATTDIGFALFCRRIGPPCMVTEE